MEFSIVTLFPDIFTSFLNESLIAKALDEKIIEINFINPRDFTEDKHKRVDDTPYGGGPGMVLRAQPFIKAIEKVKTPNSKVIYLTPSGEKLKQEKVKSLSKSENLVLICGRYEGLDQRVIDLLVDEEISIGDYVVNGGEVPAMVLIEAISRLKPNFMQSEESLIEESHSSGLLEYPHYTRPADYLGQKVPKVLLSGCHASIRKWRLTEALKRTLKRRPDLIREEKLDAESLNILAQIKKEL